ncbi:MAG: hypothetical protein RLP15_11635 [Cryomorphaceae bacterium]
MSRADTNKIKQQFESVSQSSLLDESDTSFIYYDFKILDDRIASVREAFGKSAIHTVAIKSNPLTKVLQHITAAGMGLECASFEEVLLAQNAGSKFIAWDSPAKSRKEMLASNEVDGLMINADSLRELEMLLALNQTAKIALRVNPEIDTGAHTSMNVSGARSKFGEPISHRSQIANAVHSANGRVSGIHVHTSSQTADFYKMVTAVRKAIDLALEINQHRPNTIRTIDIGGGFPAEYKEGDAFSISSYSSALTSACPELFDGTFDLVTEFGRYYHANAGWTATKVHDVKRVEGHQVLIVHVGADLFLREAYNPGVWHHDMITLSSSQANTVKSDVGGPLCFGGDYIAKNIDLPEVEPGSWLIIRDTGANSFSLWSRHCSRAFPKVIALNDDLMILRDRDSFEDILNFWS